MFSNLLRNNMTKKRYHISNQFLMLNLNPKRIFHLIEFKLHFLPNLQMIKFGTRVNFDNFSV